MQSKQELEDWYKVNDPWGYKINKDDQNRKDIIFSMLQKNEYINALDIGAGEGFIAKDLPAKIIHGLEISDLAASRFPENVKRIFYPEEKYDLIIAAGVLYQQYDYKYLTKIIKNFSKKHIIVSGIKDWLILDNFGKILEEKEYKYRNFIQRSILYEVGS